MSGDSPSSSNSPPKKRPAKAALAVHACAQCRRRKLKCNEARPSCSNCRQRSLECQYPQPVTNQIADATSSLLDTIHRLEGKFDDFTQSYASDRKAAEEKQNEVREPAGPPSGSSISAVSSQAQRSQGYQYGSSSDQTGLEALLPNQSKSSGSPKARPLTVPHSILLWPAVSNYLVQSGACAKDDLVELLQEGSSWFIKREMDSELGVLPPHHYLTPVAPTGDGSMGVSFQELTLNKMGQYSEAYFNTFNITFPVLCRSTFEREVLGNVLRIGFVEGDGASVIALFVFALGAVAIEGASHNPISVSNGIPSGIRGGSSRQPPGLAIFNEARRRQGIMSTANSLEKVQALLLQAAYFECSAHCVDFWHSITAASMVCSVLIRCQAGDWTSVRGDMVKRAYWTCVVNEELFHIDLDLPKTGIASLEDEVPMPHFHEVQDRPQTTDVSVPQQLLEYNMSTFLAMITLRRVITRIHGLLQESDELNSAYGGARIAMLEEMAQQLGHWRSTLPDSLQWSDDDSEEWAGPSSHGKSIMYNNDGRFQGNFSTGLPAPTTTTPSTESPGFQNQASQQQLPPINTLMNETPPDTEMPDTTEGFNTDTIAAALQTRYYYARLLIYLPFVHKALQSPQDMTQKDAECCVYAVRSACDWPLALAPPRNKKRLVPHLYAWTQNFIGALMILRMTMADPNLRSVCEGRVRSDRIMRAANLMLNWIYDMKQVDAIAKWGWEVLEPLFFPSG